MNGPDILQEQHREKTALTGIGLSSCYVIVLVHRDLDDFAADFMSSVRDTTKDLFQQIDLVSFREDVSEDSESNSLVVYLGSRAGCGDKRVSDLLGRAINAQLPILPIVRESDDGSIHQKIPSSIAGINAVSWTDNRTLAMTATLTTLGLVEAERKVFLSYVRRESSPIALQLHRALVEAGFDVFLDRFAVPPGAAFQSRLDEELGNKAFVVLLESCGLRSSPWVQHEIVYALSHRISVLAVTMPTVGPEAFVPAIDDAFRVRLSAGNIRSRGDLEETTLSAILELIEREHARSLRRRREQLLGSLVDRIRRDGGFCDAVDDWAFVATAGGRKPTVFLVTPRRPQPEDLRTLDCIRRRTGARMDASVALSATVVHDVEHMRHDQTSLLSWISEPRGLEVQRLRECKLEVVSS